MTIKGLLKSADKGDLSQIEVKPLSHVIAKRLVERNHYLRSFPGGTSLAFGVFLDDRVMGVVTLGAGSANACRLVGGASIADCLTPSRLWLSDDLPRNSESRTIGMVVGAIKRHTEVKFLITYSDPSRGHVGTIYQATNWLYTGLSDPTPYYALEDSAPVHSRSFSQIFGTRSKEYFSRKGLSLKTVAQSRKHRYLYFLDHRWRKRLIAPVLAYPKKES